MESSSDPIMDRVYSDYKKYIKVKYACYDIVDMLKQVKDIVESDVLKQKTDEQIANINEFEKQVDIDVEKKLEEIHRNMARL